MQIETRIVEAVKRLNITDEWVYPWMLTKDDIGMSRSVRTVRRYMVKLARDGKLERRGQRGGYAFLN